MPADIEGIWFYHFYSYSKTVTKSTTFWVLPNNDIKINAVDSVDAKVITSFRFFLGTRSSNLVPHHGQYAKPVLKITPGAFIPDLSTFN